MNTKYAIDESGCWIWKGACDRAGYGKLCVGGKRYAAHRFFYQEATGSEIPPGYCIHHLCHNRRCVNPNHLEMVTRSENNRHQRRGRKGNYSEQDIAEIRFLCQQPGDLSRRDLIEIYDGTPASMNAICTGLTWKDIEALSEEGVTNGSS